MISSLLLPLISYLPYQSHSLSAHCLKIPNSQRPSILNPVPPHSPFLSFQFPRHARSSIQSREKSTSTHLRHEPHISNHRRHSHHIDERDPRRARRPAEVLPPIGRHVYCHFFVSAHSHSSLLSLVPSLSPQALRQPAV